MPSLKHFRDPDPWMLAETIPDSDIFFFQIPFTAFANDSSYRYIRNYTKVMAEYHRFAMRFYFGECDSYEVGKFIRTRAQPLRHSGVLERRQHGSV